MAADNISVTKIKTQDVRAAFRDILTENAQTAAGNNILVSKAEGETLEPFLRRAEQEIRSDGGKGTRVKVEPLVDKAVANAEVVWEKYNPSDNGLDSIWFAKAEVRDVEKEDPALGALTRAAVQRVAQGGANIYEAVQTLFSTFDFQANEETGQYPLHQASLGGALIDARPIFPQNRAALPAGVLESYDFYRRLMDADLGAVTLQSGKIAGHDVFINFTTTDGDDGYLEVLSKSGKPVLSARLQAGELVGFDERFGRLRFSPRLVGLDDPVSAEGYSEAEEKALFGQVPSSWPGEAQLNQGQLHYDANGRLGHIEIPGLAGSANEELSLAAFEYLWDLSLKHRVLGDTYPFMLGAQGTMVVGEYTRPTDGKTFEVADWRDIDDGSFTLYFDRTPEGRLKLAINQFNN